MASTSKEVVLLKETIEEQLMEDEEVAALIGAANPFECTYSKGYLGRQMVYSCNTCAKQQQPDAQFGGFCYGCLINCHEDHDINEFQTRRNFKCDCGNSKFVGNPCKLEPEKDALNPDNRYDENFSGMPVGDSIQCFICETWIPKPHEFPSSEDYDYETTCAVCVSRLSFLGYYREHIKHKLSVEAGILTPELLELHKDSQPGCELLKRFVPGFDKLDGILAWEPNIRKLFCSCGFCKEMYKAQGVPFINDVNDFMETYLDIGLAAHDANMQEAEKILEDNLASLNRYQQGRIALGVADLSSATRDMLEPFEGTTNVVEQKDVDEMFENLKKK